MTIHTDHKNIIELITGDLTQFHVPILFAIIMKKSIYFYVNASIVW
jgi:hypothetical protein